MGTSWRALGRPWALGWIMTVISIAAVSQIGRAQDRPADPLAPDAGDAPPVVADAGDAVPGDAGAAVVSSGDAGQDGASLGLSPEELADIERATASDKKQIEAAAPAGAPTAPVSIPHALMPDIAVILDVALAWFDEDDNLQTGGHDPVETGFNLQQLELSIGKSVDPYFRFDSNIVFGLFGVEVEEAYATTLSLPASLQLRAGQFLTKFGRINATHPHSWDFVDQPFSIGRVFGGEGNRGLGVELSWLTPLPWYVEIVGSTTRAAGEGTARSFYGADDLGVRDPLDLQNTLAIEQFFDLSHDWSLLFGVSAANGPNPTGADNRTDVWGADLYLKYRPITRASPTVVSLQTEWMLRRRQVPADVLTDVSGYAQVFWKFAERWGTAARWDYGTPARGRDGDVADDPLDPDWTRDRHRASANVTFWPTEFSRLRLQGSSDVPRWRPSPIWAAFLALEVLVGAHGAHQF
jgi:hypothetical protein